MDGSHEDYQAIKRRDEERREQERRDAEQDARIQAEQGEWRARAALARSVEACDGLRAHLQILKAHADYQIREHAEHVRRMAAREAQVVAALRALHKACMSEAVLMHQGFWPREVHLTLEHAEEVLTIIDAQTPPGDVALPYWPDPDSPAAGASDLKPTS